MIEKKIYSNRYIRTELPEVPRGNRVQRLDAFTGTYLLAHQDNNVHAKALLIPEEKKREEIDKLLVELMKETPHKVNLHHGVFSLIINANDNPQKLHQTLENIRENRRQPRTASAVPVPLG